MRLWSSSAIWVTTILSVCASTAYSSYVPCLPGGGGDLKSDAKSPLVILIDTSRPRQKIRSFGASDAWSAQYVGQWPDEKREAIADLLFQTGLDDHKNPRGIGLSLWRFNLGAGSTRQKSFTDPWRRIDTFLNETFTGYDWTRCPGQRWFLQAARARGVEKFIAFVNSPPINMTKNGLASCSADSGSTNLRADKVADFARYLATILKHFRDVEGIDFEGISPFNEPNWDWNDATSQEGCRYSNSDIYRVVQALYDELQAQQIDTKIEVVEAGDLSYLYDYSIARGDYIDAFFDRDSPYYIGDKVAPRICSHSYFTCWPEDNRLVGWRKKLRTKLDYYPGLGYSMTEYCILIPSDTWVPAKYRGYGSGRNLGMDPALWVARVIHCDLTIAEASDWQWWLGISPYDYKDGLVYVEQATLGGQYSPSKMLWAMGNFSRFIRPGMTRVMIDRSDNATPESTVEDLMASAYWKSDEGTFVVVFVNRSYSSRPVRVDFQGAPVTSMIPYVTRGESGETDNLTAYKAMAPEDAVAIPPRSVVTLVCTTTNLGDWDRNAEVDFRDLAVLGKRWLGTRVDPWNLTRRAGYRELATLAGHWLADFRLSAHWKLDETSGLVARDSTGNRDGALQGGPVWQPAGGKLKGALRLDGVDDCVSTPFVLDPSTTAFTVFAWVQGGAPGQAILSQAGEANWLGAASDGTLRTELKQSGRMSKPLGSSVAITDGAWHRVGLTWDGSNRILYADGKEVARDALAGLPSSTGPVTIGAGSVLDSGSFWKGLIDDVRIHDRVVLP